MSEQYILSIDQGTTNVKACLVNQKGEIAASASSPLQLIYIGDDGVEQDPRVVWLTVKQLVRQVVSKAGVAAESIVGLICVGQYSSIVPVDASGNPTMNMVMHLDSRGAPHKLRRYDGFKRDNLWKQFQWLRIHGLPPLKSGIDSVSHMRFIKYAHPAVYECTATFLESVDFLTMKFCGRATANQCTTLLMLGIDNRRPDKATYHPKLISYSGIDRKKWPQLIPKDAIAGVILSEVAQELGLSPKTKIVTGVNDAQAGGVATSAFKGTHGVISIGTTGVIITHVDFKRTDLKHLVVSAPSPIPDTYFIVAENGLAGKVVEFFLEKLIYPNDRFADHGVDEKFAALDKVLASVPPGSNGLIFLPWLAGSTAPVEDIKMRGGILNMSLDTTREALAKAAVEGVMFNLHWLGKAVEKFAKRSFSHLLFYGGGAQSAETAQIMADVFQLPVHRVAEPDYTVARGGAFLAFQRLGILAYDDFERLLSIQTIVEPRRETAGMYAERFEQFLAAFKKTRTLFK